MLAAIRNAQSDAIHALAAIVNTPQTDEQCDAELIPREPVMEQVVRARQAWDKISAAPETIRLLVERVRELEGRIANAPSYHVPYHMGEPVTGPCIVLQDDSLFGKRVRIVVEQGERNEG
jgi:hypothetical protein